jgi:glycosyltransferase involved in cell wall biosynthesis
VIPALPHRALYASFDRFPSRKGSAVHIDRFARTLFDHAGGGLLYVLGGDDLPPYQREGAIEIVRHTREATNLLERAEGFAAHLARLLRRLPHLELAHFRDPWSGVPIVEHAPRRYRTVYEVNGLPSIELPFLHPGIPPALLRSIEALEQRCLQSADLVITPSNVTADRLATRGVTAHVVPNGADVPATSPPRPPDAPPDYLLYFGALQPWQGVDTALRAVARLDLPLVVCASVHERRAKPYRRLADKLGVDVHWRFALPEHELAPYKHHALLSLAPLKDCARNVLQGCAPLKVLESMAAGVPVVAADLPVTRELMTDGVHGRLVAPDRPGELARAIRVLLDHPDERARMGEAARAHVTDTLTWERSTARLRDLYGPRPERMAA